MPSHTPANATARRWISPIPSRGFTIIELLVGIAIISLLMAILLPALSNARALGKRTTCVTRLREVGLAAQMYLQSDRFFPLLNNEPSDGHWQYNYLIWDGRDFEHNFGPFVERNLIPEKQMLYCPVQASAYHQYQTFVNPWPVQELLDTRAGFGRRPLISGLDVTRLPASQAIYADLFHTPDYIENGHKSGVNVVFSDGHAKYVSGVHDLLDNDMTLPTSMIDNPKMLELWEKLDHHK